MASATSAVGMVKPANTSATPRFPRCARDEVDDGEQRGRAGLFRQRGGGDRDPGEEPASASRANRMAAVIDGSMNTSKFAA